MIDLDTPEHGGQVPESWAAERGVRDGLDVLRVLAGRAGQPLPATYSVHTPSGGLHRYFAALDTRPIGNSAGRVGPMIDVRGDGGYVVA
ncbi:MAG: bifunctional DNA primase/polymerase, partial [Streptosporangiaceae bacterium]